MIWELTSTAPDILNCIIMLECINRSTVFMSLCEQNQISLWNSYKMPFFKRPEWTNLYLFMHNELVQGTNNLNSINLDTTDSDLVVSKQRFHNITGGLEVLQSPSASLQSSLLMELGKPDGTFLQRQHFSHISPLQGFPYDMT